VLGKSSLHLFARELNLLKETSRDIDERILRPGEEPINRRAVDETGEHSSTNSEGITDRGEAECNVIVLTRLILEVLEQSSRGIFDTGTLCFRAELAKVAV